MSYAKGGKTENEDFNAIVDQYKRSFQKVGGLNIAYKADAESIRRTDWEALWAAIYNKLVENEVSTAALPVAPGFPGQNPFGAGVAANFRDLVTYFGAWPDVGIVEEPIQPGSQEWTKPGTYTFTVPNFNWLRVKVWGAGGAGAPHRNDWDTYTTDGGDSKFGSLTAGGGNKGYGGYPWNTKPYGRRSGYGGLGGTAAGGNEKNVKGEQGQAQGGTGVMPYGYVGCPKGGTAYGGGNLKNCTQYLCEACALMPGPGSVGGFGQGGGGEWWENTNGTVGCGGGGGGGGYVQHKYNKGELGAKGATVTVIVGKGGKGYSTSGDGGPGRVSVEWGK